MPAKYTLTVQEGKDKGYQKIDFAGSGFVNNSGYVNLSVNLTRLFKIAKERPDLLKEYNGDKQIYINTNIKVDSNGANNTQHPTPAPQPSYTAEDLDDEIPF